MIKSKIQDKQYDYPYHYIPRFKGGFKQHIVWTWGIDYISTIEYILDYLAKQKFESLIDIGCGDGRLVREISDKFTNKKVSGVDSSQKAINLAKALNPELDFRKLDILKKEPERTFDIATLIEVFEHIPVNKCKLFSERISRTIKKGGLLIITVPHKNKPKQKKHYQHFDRKTLLSYYSDDFEEIQVTHFSKRSIFSAFLKKILVNNLFILNNDWISNVIYRIYKKYCFLANNKNCGRILVVFRKK